MFICPQAETNSDWLKIGYFGIFRLVKGVIFRSIELKTLLVRIILELSLNRICCQLKPTFRSNFAPFFS